MIWSVPSQRSAQGGVRPLVLCRSNCRTMLWITPLLLVIAVYGKSVRVLAGYDILQPVRGIFLYNVPAVPMGQRPHKPQYRDSPTIAEATGGVSIVVSLIGRDVGDELPYVLRNIERLHKVAQFKRTVVLLVENDSVDNTVSVFKAWADRVGETTGGRLTGDSRSLTFHDGKKSIGVLGRARNVYLSAVRDEFTWADYLIAVDTDMCHPWQVEEHVSILNNLMALERETWDVVLANGVCGWYIDPPDGSPARETHRGSKESHVQPIYCDLLALEDSSGRHHYGFDVRLLPGQCDVVPQIPGIWQPPECASLGGLAAVPVRAAFGGWGIYRASTLRNATDCTYPESGASCEHTPLHTCLGERHGAKLYIMPGLVVNWEGCKGPVLDQDPDYDL